MGPGVQLPFSTSGRVGQIGRPQWTQASENRATDRSLVPGMGVPDAGAKFPGDVEGNGVELIGRDHPVEQVSFPGPPVARAPLRPHQHGRKWAGPKPVTGEHCRQSAQSQPDVDRVEPQFERVVASDLASVGMRRKLA
jgi:hypothetical protein